MVRRRDREDPPSLRPLESPPARAPPADAPSVHDPHQPRELTYVDIDTFEANLWAGF